MSILDRLAEMVIPKKPRLYKEKSNASGISQDEVAKAVTGLNYMNTNKLISGLQDISSIHIDRYREYEIMEQDTLIQSALELYADDSTSTSQFSDNIVKVTSEDSNLAKDLNNLLSNMDIDTYVWNWAYQLARSGDHYVSIEFDDLGIPKLIDYDDPACIMDIWELGERLFYLEDRSVHQSSVDYEEVVGRFTNYIDDSIRVIPKNNLVHFMIRKSSNYSVLELLVPEERDEDGNPAIRTYSILRGSSMLESVRYIYRLLRQLEDSLVSLRVNKSQYVRLFNIEVADSTPEVTTKTINEIKNLFDSKAVFDTNSGTYSSHRVPRPRMDPIFNPIRNGLGVISTDEIGGEVNISDIADIEYFMNKLYAGLKIPKAYLGWEDSITGGIGNDSLVHIDMRYAKTVSRIVKGLTYGIQDILDLWLIQRGRSGSIGTYRVEISLSNEAELLNSINNLSEVFQGISNVVETVSATMGEYVNTPKLLKSLLDVYLDNPKLLELLTPELNKAIRDYEQDIQSDSVESEVASDSKIEEGDSNIGSN